MEALERILNNLKVKNTTSQVSKTKYKCSNCKDTGWILIPKENSQPIAKQCDCVKQGNLINQWKEYGVDPTTVKRVADYEVYPGDKITEKAKNIASNYVFNYFKNKSYNSWIAFMGQPGGGKSHLSKAIGAALLLKGVHVVYMPYEEAIMELKGNAINHEKYSHIIEKYMKCELLIIDDLFKDKIKNMKLIGDITEVDMKHIYPLLNYRYNNNLATIISTECTPELLIDIDGALCGRILEKCGTNRVVFRGAEYNYRLKGLIRD